MQAQAGAAVKVARFVKLGAANHRLINAAAATDLIVGISQEGSYDSPLPANTNTDKCALAAGDQFEYFPWGSEALLIAGVGGLTRGVPATSDADGLGVDAAATNYVGFLPFETVIAGEKCRGLVTSPYKL